MRLLEWDEALRPEGGKLLLRPCAGPLSISYKEPAGVAFQNAILRQQGLLGENWERCSRNRGTAKRRYRDLAIAIFSVRLLVKKLG